MSRGLSLSKASQNNCQPLRIYGLCPLVSCKWSANQKTRTLSNILPSCQMLINLLFTGMNVKNRNKINDPLFSKITWRKPISCLVCSEQKSQKFTKFTESCNGPSSRYMPVLLFIRQSRHRWCSTIAVNTSKLFKFLFFQLNSGVIYFSIKQNLKH